MSEMYKHGRWGKPFFPFSFFLFFGSKMCWVTALSLRWSTHCRGEARFGRWQLFSWTTLENLFLHKYDPVMHGAVSRQSTVCHRQFCFAAEYDWSTLTDTYHLLQIFGDFQSVPTKLQSCKDVKFFTVLVESFRQKVTWHLATSWRKNIIASFLKGEKAQRLTFIMVYEKVVRNHVKKSPCSGLIASFESYTFWARSGTSQSGDGSVETIRMQKSTNKGVN